jgi:hypothetical protein
LPAQAKAYVQKQWAGLPQASVGELVTALRSNQVTFERRWLHKRVVIHGYVQTVTATGGGEAVLFLKPSQHASVLTGMVAIMVKPDMADGLEPGPVPMAIDCEILGKVGAGNVAAGRCQTLGLADWMPKPATMKP